MKKLVLHRFAKSSNLAQRFACIRPTGLTALLLCTAPLQAQTLSSVYLYRGQEWVQTDAATSAPKAPNSLFWGVEVTGTGLSAPVITLPGDPATNNVVNTSQHNGGVLGFNVGDGAWEYGSPNFDNISFPNTGGAGDRNARFPDGLYTIAISGLSTVNLTYHLISSTVMLFSLTNTGGGWSGGTYYFDPTQPLNISSAGTAFTNFNTVSASQINGAIKFGIFDGGGNPISGTTSTRFYLDDINPATNPNYINYTLPANTLTAGSTYKVLGNYIAIADQNTTNGATNLAFFNGLNSITLTAIPEPSTYAAIFGVIGLGAGLWRRRSVRPRF